jgi:hypothetical protein
VLRMPEGEMIMDSAIADDHDRRLLPLLPHASAATRVQTRWQRWCSRFDDAYGDVQMMFHIRHIWKNLIAMLEQNTALSDTAIVKNWLIRTYVDRQCSAIRRLNDNDSRAASVRRCLSILIVDPLMVTRALFEQRATEYAANRNDIEAVVLHGRGVGGHVDFADASGDHLDVARVEQDLATLESATATLESATASVNSYTHKRVAHFEHGVDMSALALMFGDLDEAIDRLGNLASKYYNLRHAGQWSWPITPLVIPPTWLTAFQLPWWTSDFKPIREDTLG